VKQQPQAGLLGRTGEPVGQIGGAPDLPAVPPRHSSCCFADLIQEHEPWSEKLVERDDCVVHRSDCGQIERSVQRVGRSDAAPGDDPIVRQCPTRHTDSRDRAAAAGRRDHALHGVLWPGEFYAAEDGGRAAACDRAGQEHPGRGERADLMVERQGGAGVDVGVEAPPRGTVQLMSREVPRADRCRSAEHPPDELRGRAGVGGTAGPCLIAAVFRGTRPQANHRDAAAAGVRTGGHRSAANLGVLRRPR